MPGMLILRAMPRFSKQQLQTIIDRDLPGYQMVARDEPAVAVKGSVAVSLQPLTEQIDDELVTVEEAGTRLRQRKTVVISGETAQVIGMQG